MATAQTAPRPTTADGAPKLCCPDCGDARPYRSERRGLEERITCWLRGVLPYRCRQCDCRFFAPKSSRSTSSKKSS